MDFTAFASPTRLALAEAFDRAGERDSASMYYRRVVDAWQRADPDIQRRRAFTSIRFRQLSTDHGTASSRTR